MPQKKKQSEPLKGLSSQWLEQWNLCHTASDEIGAVVARCRAPEQGSIRALTNNFFDLETKPELSLSLQTRPADQTNPNFNSLVSEFVIATILRSYPLG
jgi:hypothetical protein